MESPSRKANNSIGFWIISILVLVLLVSSIPLYLMLLKASPRLPVPAYATASIIEQVYARQIERLKKLLSSNTKSNNLTEDDKKLFSQGGILSAEIGHGETIDHIIYSSPQARGFNVSFPREVYVGASVVNIGFSESGNIAIYETMFRGTDGKTKLISLEFDMAKLQKSVQQWMKTHNKRMHTDSASPVVSRNR